MASRAIFKGAVTFSGAAVPVKLYTAVRQEKVDFHLLHDQDNSRLEQRMICPLDQENIALEDRVKGFQIEKGTYALFEQGELEELEPQTTRQIEVVQFVEPWQVDPRYYDRPYYLGPDNSEKKFAALLAALERTKMSAVCQWSMRKKNYIAQLRCHENTLLLMTLHFAEEIIDIASLNIPSAKIQQKELETAKYLIDMLAGDFDSGKFINEYQEKVKHLVEEKAAGIEVHFEKPKHVRATSQNKLLETLEASVEQARSRKHEHAAAAS